MSARFEDVCTEIAARLEAVQGLDQVYAVEPDSVVAPCAVVSEGDGDFIEYAPDMSSDSCNYLVSITLYVPAPDGPTGKQAMHRLLRPSGPTSVRQAVGIWSSVLGVSYRAAVASGMRGVKFDRNDARYIACDIVVRVTA